MKKVVNDLTVIVKYLVIAGTTIVLSWFVLAGFVICTTGNADALGDVGLIAVEILKYMVDAPLSHLEELAS